MQAGDTAAVYQVFPVIGRKIIFCVHFGLSSIYLPSLKVLSLPDLQPNFVLIYIGLPNWLFPIALLIHAVI